MNGLNHDSRRDSPGDAIDRIRGEFAQSLMAGGKPQIEQHLARVAETLRSNLFRELLKAELSSLSLACTVEVRDDYRKRFPAFDEIVVDLFARIAVTASGASTHNSCADEDSVAESQFPDSPPQEPPPRPDRIGRYEIRRSLGHGSYGHVYLAHDEELGRLVALKVPRADRFSSEAAIDAFLAEARAAARLNHAGIVKVHDVLRDEGRLVVVMEYVEGRSLSELITTEQLTPQRAAELLAQISDAVNYANENGLVHRDIKPANILIDSNQRPRVADFGLAIHESSPLVRKRERAGTPPYMAPEQIRGETHRLDGRSDQWSLGVILYELLTGHRPFKGHTRSELFAEIAEHDPKPPRQIDSRIPAELQRICLKCLSKRMSDRYETVSDLAADLRHWNESVAAVNLVEAPKPTATPSPDSEKPAPIVPKGLRSFDEHDADFFLQLLPGPRDRNGLPDMIRFWKTKIEERDADLTFSVGLVYGPSGSGKSSLVRAGLIPHLTDNVVTVFVESTSDETELRLQKTLRKHFPDLPKQLSLPDTLAAIREGHWTGSGNKLVIVLDQFEQWLHARHGEFQCELTDALRHCDGGRIQCIVMVRDDFWMAVTHFLDELEVGQVAGANIAAIESFDVQHARRVLGMFGRAYRVLDEDETNWSREQLQFLEQSVSGLSEQGKVICVRLALFADMMKGRPWTPGALRQVGGTEGVGATFLEETFGSEVSSPKHRLHQKAARAVLAGLLPESGTEIKGRMRARAELLEASGYSRKPKDFEDLIGILDGEARLITPTDPDGVETDNDAYRHHESAQSYYQLTHDYLVPALRDWLTRKQRETRRGRAELKLTERTALWSAHRERKQLPSFVEWINIRLLISKSKWTEPQRLMMAKAGTLNWFFLILIGVALTAAGHWSYERVDQWQTSRRERREAERLAARLRDAEEAHVQGIIADMGPYRPTINPLLYKGLSDAVTNRNSHQELRFRLALASVDRGQVEVLYQRLLKASPNEIRVICNSLYSERDFLRPRLWAVLERTDDSSQVLRAATALAVLDLPSDRWDGVSKTIVEQLVAQQPNATLAWARLLKPVNEKLRAPLLNIAKGTNVRQRNIARTILFELFPSKQ